jgi:carboxymethylenebutenolidase
MIHEVFGLNDQTRRHADRLARAGYLTLALDLFSDGGPRRCLVGTMRAMAAHTGRPFIDIATARKWLAESDLGNGRTGVIGFCMGGGFALLLAGRPGWSVASVNYGPVPDNVEDVLSGACPVVASFGGRDRGFTGAAEKLRTAADAAGVPADVKEYPGARHAFINRISVASPLTPLLKVAGVGYDHDAAADAKRRILRFFDEHLRVPVSPG